MTDDIIGEEILVPMDVQLNELNVGEDYKITMRGNTSFIGEYIGSKRNIIKFYVYTTINTNTDFIRSYRSKKRVEPGKYEVIISDIEIENIENVEEENGPPILKGGKKSSKKRRSKRRSSKRRSSKRRSRSSKRRSRRSKRRI